MHDYCGIGISGGSTTGELAKQLVNSGFGEMYLYSKNHYNAVINNYYSGLTFSETGKSHVHLVNKADVKPEPGDIIFFRWGGTNKREISHVGIVESYSNGVLTTIEGNTSYAGSHDPDIVGMGTRDFYSSQVIGIIKLNS